MLPQVHPTIHNLLGAPFVGFSISNILYGQVALQTWTYYQRYSHDRLAYKILVGVLFSLLTAGQIFLAHGLYFYDITMFGKLLQAFSRPIIWSFEASVFTGALIGFIVRLCFTSRVWTFSDRNWIVTGSLIFLNVVTLGFSTVYAVEGLASKRFIGSPELSQSSNAALATGAGTDILTAMAMCFYLRKYRTGHNKEADSIASRLMLYSLNCGIMTSLISFTVLIVYDLMPYNLIFMGVWMVQSKLHVNSLLATLNTRRTVKGKNCDTEKGNTNSILKSRTTSVLQTPSFDSSPRGFNGNTLQSFKSRDVDNTVIIHSAKFAIAA